MNLDHIHLLPISLQLSPDSLNPLFPSPTSCLLPLLKNSQETDALVSYNIPITCSAVFSEPKSNYLTVGYPKIQVPLLYLSEFLSVLVVVVALRCYSWIGLLIAFLPWQIAWLHNSPWLLKSSLMLIIPSLSSPSMLPSLPM